MLGSVTPDAAARLRPDWKTKRTPPSSAAAVELAWLDGVLAALRTDTAAHARAHAQLPSDTSRITSVLRRSLAAFALFARGDTSAAAKGLTDLETENAQTALHMRFGADHPFVPAVHRMAASGWLLAIGDTVTAARLLTWHEAVLSTGYPVELASRVAEPVALFRRAGIEEARHQTGPARRHYQAFLERYDRPAAPHATMTAAAVEALARLRRN